MKHCTPSLGKQQDYYMLELSPILNQDRDRRPVTSGIEASGLFQP
jgi:hypothetical protein